MKSLLYSEIIQRTPTKEQKTPITNRIDYYFTDQITSIVGNDDEPRPNSEVDTFSE